MIKNRFEKVYRQSNTDLKCPGGCRDDTGLSGTSNKSTEDLLPGNFRTCLPLYSDVKPAIYLLLVDQIKEGDFYLPNCNSYGLEPFKQYLATQF